MITMVMRNSQIGCLARKTLGATDIKYGMNIRPHSGSNMDWVPPSHTSSFPCRRQKNPKMVFQQKRLMNPYTFGIKKAWVHVGI